MQLGLAAVGAAVGYGYAFSAFGAFAGAAGVAGTYAGYGWSIAPLLGAALIDESGNVELIGSACQS